MSQPVVYVSTRNKCQQGMAAGQWLAPTRYPDDTALYEACRQLHRDEAEPSLQFLDFEGFHASLFHEHRVDPMLWQYHRITQMIGRRVVDAGLELRIPLNEIEQRYFGQFSTSADFADSYCRSLGLGQVQRDSDERWRSHRLNLAVLGSDLLRARFEHFDGVYFTRSIR